MIFSYRSTLVNRETNRAKNLLTPIDTEHWIEVARMNEMGFYGNTADLVESCVLPLLVTEKHDELGSVVHELDRQWHKHNRTVIFQLAMFVWAGFKSGRYSRETWATVLASTWQSGSRGMMATVKLSQAQVVEMFKAAPRDVLLRAAEFDGDDLVRDYNALEDAFQVFRGVSTGIDHFEDGFSWSLDPQQALTFATLNCQNKKEIPGLVSAIVSKDSVLAIFSYEKEVVVDPTVKKIEVEKYFLRGKQLRDFHCNVDVDANTLDVVFNTGYQKKRTAAQKLPSQRSGISSALSSQQQFAAYF
jgi:hypothetical protein